MASWGKNTMSNISLRRPLVAAGVAAGVAASVLLAGPATARSTKAAPTCGSVITTDTKLTADLTCEGTALVLNRGITLDLGGHSITGRGTGATTGILVVGPATVRPTVIRGGTLSRWQAGIRTEPDPWVTSRVEVSRLTANRAPLTLQTTDLRVTASRLTDSDLNTYAGRTSVVDSRLVRSSAMHETTLFRLVRSTLIGGTWGGDENQQVEIVDSVLDGRGTVGLPPSMCGGNVCRISGSTIRNYTYPLSPWYGATITDTTFADNPNGAISAEADGLVTVTRSRFVRNGAGNQPAITVAYRGKLSVRDSAFASGGAGIRVDDGADGSQVAVRGSSFRDHSIDGIYSEVPGVRLGSNSAIGNGGWGIYAPGAVDEGGNVARDNGAAGQCSGVTCAPR